LRENTRLIEQFGQLAVVAATANTTTSLEDGSWNMDRKRMIALHWVLFGLIIPEKSYLTQQNCLRVSQISVIGSCSYFSPMYCQSIKIYDNVTPLKSQDILEEKQDFWFF